LDTPASTARGILVEQSQDDRIEAPELAQSKYRPGTCLTEAVGALFGGVRPARGGI